MVDLFGSVPLLWHLWTNTTYIHLNWSEQLVSTVWVCKIEYKTNKKHLYRLTTPMIWTHFLYDILVVIWPTYPCYVVISSTVIWSSCIMFWGNISQNWPSSQLIHLSFSGNYLTCCNEYWEYSQLCLLTYDYPLHKYLLLTIIYQVSPFYAMYWISQFPKIHTPQFLVWWVFHSDSDRLTFKSLFLYGLEIQTILVYCILGNCI